MKLRTLAVNQFKKFTSPVKISGIEDGLNVLVGPNEMGKSTLLDALRAVLFEKHDSKAKVIKDLQNERNKAGPVVKLTFELDDGVYSITKRFMKKPYARLDCPDGRKLERDDAESELRDLLGFSEPGRTSANPETLGIWNVLWVRQGQSFGAISLPESARLNLHSALESEVGIVLGGRRGHELPQTIENMLRELRTATGKPKGKLKDARERVQSLEKDLKEQKEKRKNLSDTLENLEESRKKEKNLSNPVSDEENRKELAEARGRQKELEALEDRIKTAEVELKIRDMRLKEATEKKSLRRKLENEITEEKNATDSADKELKETGEKEERVRLNVEETSGAFREAETAEKKTKENVLKANQILKVSKLKKQVDSLQSKWQEAAEVEKRRREAQRRATANSVTNEAMERVRTAEKKLKGAEDHLDAVATLITFDMENLSGVEINGAGVSEEQSPVRAVEQVVIGIPERGKIIIKPVVKNRDKMLNQRAEAEAELKNALIEAGVSTVQDAETRHAERVEAIRQADLALKEAELRAPATDEYEAGAQALEDFINGLKARFECEMKELAIEELPATREAEKAEKDARIEAEEARDSLDEARGPLSGLRETHASLQTKLDAIKEKLKERKQRLAEKCEQLRREENECSEEEIQTGISAARKDLKEQETVLDELKEERDADETLEQVKARVERLDKAMDNRRKKRNELEVKIGQLKERVEIFDGAGIDEIVESQKRDLEMAEEEQKRFEREADVLEILLSELRVAEREAKELYLSPVLSRLRPYLCLLFPGADIGIDKDLHITGVVREEGYEEPFPLLSMGTQEQIAVLVRLAFAEMLAERERPVAVVLDDALVFSDDARMDRMFDILNVAAKKFQVLIFTCREQLFEGIGGKNLAMNPADPEELMSA